VDSTAVNKWLNRILLRSVSQTLAIMKISLLVILLLISSVSVAGTIKKSDLVGEWQFYVPEHSIRYKLAALISGASSHKMKLTIKNNEEIIFVRELGNGETESIKANRIEVVDDVYIVYLPESTEECIN